MPHEIEFAGRAAAPEHIAEAMNIEPGTELVVRRRRLFDPESGQPEEVGASYLPVAIAGGTLLEDATVVPKALFLCVEELTGKRYACGRDQWVHTAYADDKNHQLETKRRRSSPGSSTGRRRSPVPC